MPKSESNPYHFKNHRTAWNEGFAAYIRRVLRIANPYHRVWIRGRIKRTGGTSGYYRAWNLGWDYAAKYYALQQHTTVRNKRGVRGGV